MARKALKFDDIWFQLHVGHIETHEDGAQSFSVAVTPGISQIKYSEAAEQIDQESRQVLHHMLDVAIDKCNLRLAKARQPKGGLWKQLTFLQG